MNIAGRCRGCGLLLEPDTWPGAGPDPYISWSSKSASARPTTAVLHLPAGEGMGTSAGQAAAARTFVAATRAGHLAVADYANTHNPKLISSDGQATWALINVPNPDVPLGSGVVGRIQPAMRAAAPAGVLVSVTGFEQIQSAGGGGGGGPSVLIETLIAGAGALAVLLFVYGSAIGVGPCVSA